MRGERAARGRPGWGGNAVARRPRRLVPLLLAVVLAGALPARGGAPSGDPGRGSLRVTAVGSAVEVWLDERLLGRAEPARDLLAADLPARTYQLVARRPGRTWQRVVEVAPGRLTEVTVDLDPGLPGRRLGLTAEALAQVDDAFIEAPDFGALRAGALRGLEQALHGEGFQVSEGPHGVTVAYRLPGEPPTRLTFTGEAERETALADLAVAVALARRVGSGHEPVALERAMLREAIRRLDPYSAYLDPEAHREFQAETAGSFGGLGIEVAIRGEQLTVVAPLEGTPAWRAGLRPADRIVAVDGVPTRGLGLAEVVRRIRGPQGTAVTLTLVRAGIPHPLHLTLVRELIQVQSVRAEEVEPGLAYVRIRQFQERTAHELDTALERLERARPLRGILLDLRHNPGGLLTTAVAVAERFLGDGQLIAATEGRRRSQSMRFVAHPRRALPGLPLVVLVNAGSASAAEIVAAALQDHARAVVVGERTFGKGTVQTILALSDGSALRLTTARYLTPRGRSLQGQGVSPDIPIEGRRAADR